MLAADDENGGAMDLMHARKTGWIHIQGRGHIGPRIGAIGGGRRSERPATRRKEMGRRGLQWAADQRLTGVRLHPLETVVRLGEREHVQRHRARPGRN